MQIKFLTAIILLLPFISFAQSPMSVSSFERMDNDMDARINYPMKDQNGKTCAIIKIETTLPLNEFTFDGGMIGIFATKQEKGEIWLYQSPGARYITIKHENHTPLRQYQYLEPLQEATVYVMKLVSANKIVTYEEATNFQYLIIRCNIPGASVSINNSEGEAFLEGIFKKRMDFGKYFYEVKAPMYLPFVGQVELTTNKQNYEVNAELIPNFAEITINSIPEQGAEIFINNEFKGTTPLLIEKMIVGTHDLLLTKPMYRSYTQKIIVESQKPQTLNIPIQPTFANIEITTDESAEIFINDEYKSKGHWRGRLTKGNYKLEAKKESHQSAIGNMEVEEGKDRQVKLSNPIPIVGKIDVDCSEIGATIYIDDKDCGQTPKIIEGVLIGERKLRIEKEGFEIAEQKINIEQGKLIEVKLKLNKNSIAKTNKISLSKKETVTEQLYNKYGKISGRIIDFSVMYNEYNNKDYIYSIGILPFRIAKLEFSLLNIELVSGKNLISDLVSDADFILDSTYSKLILLYAPTVSYLIPITQNLNISPYIKYSINLGKQEIDYSYVDGSECSIEISTESHELSLGLSLEYRISKSENEILKLENKWLNKKSKSLNMQFFTEYRKRLYNGTKLKTPEGFYFGLKLGF